MAHLFEPFQLRSVTLRNRIGISPMCMYSAVDGVANDWHRVHYGSRATGGAGLIIQEATAVEARGRITPDDLGLWNDAQIEPLAQITRFIKAYGAVPGIQLAHAGRKASTHRPFNAPASGSLALDDPLGWQTVGPSPLAFAENYHAPQALTISEIQVIQEAFAAAAGRALAAGYELLEIHAAHGYLLHSFNSPISNQRSDTYGGSFENRTRFLRETTARVRSIWPERLPLIVRLSCTDWVEGGWELADSVRLAQILKAEGVDLVDCSSGGSTRQGPANIGAGYMVPFAETIRREAGIPTAAVGLITAPEQADEIIRNGRADLALIARASLYDPNWPIHAAQALKKEAPIPGQYLRGF